MQGTVRGFAYTFLALPIVAGLIAALATFILFAALTFGLWLPFWRELHDRGMYVYDHATAFLIAFGSPVVGLMFVATTLVAQIVAQKVNRPFASEWVIRLFLLVPAVATYCLLNPPKQSMWHYPLAETAVLLVGLGVGQLIIWLQREW